MRTLSELPAIGYGTLSTIVSLGYNKKELENYCRGIISNFSNDMESLVRYYIKELDLEIEIEGMYFDALSNSMYMYVEENEVGIIQPTCLQTDNDIVFTKGKFSEFLVKKRMLGVKLNLKEQRGLMDKEEAIAYVKQLAPKSTFQGILNKFISKVRVRYEKIKTGKWTKLNKINYKSNINTSMIECYFLTRTEKALYFYRYFFHNLYCVAIARRCDEEECFKQYLKYLYLRSNYAILYANVLTGEEMYML